MSIENSQSYSFFTSNRLDLQRRRLGSFPWMCILPRYPGIVSHSWVQLQMPCSKCLVVAMCPAITRYLSLCQSLNLTVPTSLSYSALVMHDKTLLHTNVLLLGFSSHSQSICILWLDCLWLNILWLEYLWRTNFALTSSRRFEACGLYFLWLDSLWLDPCGLHVEIVLFLLLLYSYKH